MADISKITLSGGTYDIKDTASRNGTINVRVFDTVDDMTDATDLVGGSLVETYGFYAKGDGGGAKYQIRNKVLNEVADDMFVFDVGTAGTLVAEIVPENDTNVLQYGIKNDGSENVTTKLQAVINKGLPLYMKDGDYLIEGTLTGNITIVGESQNTVLDGGTTKHNVIDTTNASSTQKAYICNLAFKNAMIDVYPRENNQPVYASKSDTRNIYMQNVWFDEAVSGDGSTYWGTFIKTPMPTDYTRYGHSGYACYPVEIVNNSGYNAVMINNVCTNESGTAQSVSDNSAVGIIDKVTSSAPTVFVSQQGASRDFLGLNNASATYHQDNRVVEVNSQGHMALGCRVAPDGTHTGYATLKLNDENPSITFYSNRSGETVSQYGNILYGGGTAKRGFSVTIGGYEVLRMTTRGNVVGRTFSATAIPTIPRADLIEGEQIWDSTNHRPLWYNGSVWKDGAGNTAFTPQS